MDLYFPKIKDIYQAHNNIKDVVFNTPLMMNYNLSEKYGASIYLKREDLQTVRSYKIRGAYNKISSIDKISLKNGVVCASAGNHAQGVAFSCNKLQIKGTIFMPSTTPKQKIEQVKMFGREYAEVIIAGDNFDSANREALDYCRLNKSTYIHPFNDSKIIEGQATMGIEILGAIKSKIDYLIVPIGGGGLASGLGSLFKELSPNTSIIGVEPYGAQSMRVSLERGSVTEIDEIDTFVDGAAVKRVGELTFEICKRVLDDIFAVPEGAICSSILELYNKNAIVAEPAGALSIAALSLISDKIKGKTVVSIVSGSNNDITRTEEIRERSLLYEGLKHYFIIRFPQRSGALLTFVRNVLGPKDDITHFSYSKKTNREQGPALVGIEMSQASDFNSFIKRLEENNIVYEYLNDKQDLFGFLI